MNEITLQLVDSSSNTFLSQIHTLYHSSFPEAERRPWSSITSLIESRMPFFKLFAAITPNGEFAGFVSIWELPKTLYIEHLAVESKFRSNGIGGNIIESIKHFADGKPVVVEVELPDSNEDAPRRISFYNRHGFMALSDFKYFQPPYAPGLPDVELMLMTTRTLEDPVEFVIILHTLVYNQ